MNRNLFWTMMMSVLALGILGTAGAEEAQTVSNVQTAVYGNYLKITYDLETADSQPGNVFITLSKDNGVTFPFPVTTVRGDVGDAVAPGTGKTAYWDFYADYPAELIDQAKVRVTSPLPPLITLTLPGGVPLEMVWIPAGTFLMGRYSGELGSSSNEAPQHTVTFGSGFYMGKYEITQQQWLAVRGSWPGAAPSSTYGVGNTYPAYEVNWNDAQNFITSLNAHLASTGQRGTVRLPSEAEWEYACRAGTATRFYWGTDASYTQVGTYAWYTNNGGGKTHPVGEKLPNSWGLYDMSGNVLEWVQDYWHSDYTGAPADGSAWVSPTSSSQVLRGGNLLLGAADCRSAHRNSYTSDYRYHYHGFRLLRTP
jgi:formylglycine-generating enzyme required for sulfatase activity